MSMFIYFLQDHNIPIGAVPVDLSTEKNLQGLVKIGENLLHKPLSKDDYKINYMEPMLKDRHTLTYAGILSRFAKLLSDERKLRFQNLEQDANHNISWNLKFSARMLHPS